MVELIVLFFLFLVVFNTVSLFRRYFCVHEYQRYGETHHMFIDLKTEKLGGYKRETLACVKCGKVKKGNTFDDNF